MEKTKLNYRTAIEFLWPFIRKYKKNFALFYMGWTFDMALSIVMPLLFGVMIDQIVYYKNINSFIQISILFVVLIILSCILYFFIYAHQQYLIVKYTFDIKLAVFNHLMELSPTEHNNLQTAKTSHLMQRHALECLNFLTRNIIYTFNNVIVIFLYGLYIFKISWQIGIIMIFAIPFSLYSTIEFGKKIRGFAETERKKLDSFSSWIFEMFNGIKDIRMLGAVPRVNGKFVSYSRDLIKTGINAKISTLTCENIINFINLAVQLIIFTLSAYMSLVGAMTIGSFVVVLTFYNYLKKKITETNRMYLDSQSRIDCIQAIHDFLQLPTEREWEGIEELHITEGNIEFEEINFSYDKQQVFEKFSLKIYGGTKLGLVGKSGVGKTTLAYLLLGFYKISGGNIKIDGQPLNRCSLKSIRRNIGLVSQDVLIFDMSIKDNILLGNRKASEEDIIDACKKAGIFDFIISLEDGFNTILGSKGIQLSGGQNQRISIARILLKNPSIIIFDEATSKLDKDTEQEILRQWYSSFQDKTCIFIAHNTRTIEKCEYAALIGDGSLYAIDTPQKLIEENDYFKSLFKDREALA